MMWRRCKMSVREIKLSVSNPEEFENAINREFSESVQVLLLGESDSRKFFVCEVCARYAVFEKSPDEGFDGKVNCRFISCQSVGPESDEGIVRETLWKEHSGCVNILYYDWLVERSDNVCVVWDEKIYEARERAFRSAKGNRLFLVRKKTARSLLGKTVDIEIDRPVGYVHGNGKTAVTYPVNYGFVPGVTGGDGEEIDVYLLGITEPVKSFNAKIIGIIHRENDNEDKLVAVPDGVILTKEEIARQTHFQEQCYDSFIETEDSLYECKMRDCAFDRKIPEELEHLLRRKTISHFRGNTFGIYSIAEFNNYLSAFEQAGKSEKYVTQICEKSEYVTNPRTLFIAIWREFMRQGYRITPDEEIGLNFRFTDNGMAVDVSLKNKK